MSADFIQCYVGMRGEFLYTYVFLLSLCMCVQRYVCKCALYFGMCLFVLLGMHGPGRFVCMRERQRVRGQKKSATDVYSKLFPTATCIQLHCSKIRVKTNLPTLHQGSPSKFDFPSILECILGSFLNLRLFI